MSKPKLELQVNMPQTIKLLQTEPATGENAYGQWFLYNVQSNGQELSFFAPDKIVKKFQEHQVQENDEVVITKRLFKNGKTNIVDYDIAVLEQKPVTVVNGHAGNGHAKPVVTHSNNGHDVVENKDYQLLLQCMTEAMMIRDELGSDIDINKLGVTLFLRKIKA
ncbi:MAG: hypothetical protein IPG99_15305 [Ignavibacteria bacterium]|nr:hypothetical protein [Ignavibacteria bacterium]